MSTILILRDRRRGSGYLVKYMRLDKHGLALHRTIDCKTIDEAKAEAADVNRRLFGSHARIVGLKE